MGASRHPAQFLTQMPARLWCSRQLPRRSLETIGVSRLIGRRGPNKSNLPPSKTPMPPPPPLPSNTAWLPNPHILVSVWPQKTKTRPICRQSKGWHSIGGPFLTKLSRLSWKRYEIRKNIHRQSIRSGRSCSSPAVKSKIQTRPSICSLLECRVLLRNKKGINQLKRGLERCNSLLPKTTIKYQARVH